MKKKLFWQSLSYYALFVVCNMVFVSVLLNGVDFVVGFGDGVMLYLESTVVGMVGFWVFLISFLRITRHGDCIHEAGHAVMCQLYGCKVEHMTMERVWHGKLSDDAQILHVKICLAGWVAEDIFGICFAGVGSNVDLEKAYAEAVSFLGQDASASDIEALLARLYHEVKWELEQEKWAVSKLANELARRKRLSGDEVDNILYWGVII